ncbi:E3 ubiquitin-protein ligase TRIM39-like [Bombina bombina]|uniref:E3 ubiquitin-protein ligase TRIM39-like n=1 Tax=Bombina bombina TaxID=8345 RepID=UPI00235B051A|nr:E3 ubiquitin-protein ligase TRIM39-like [Bombina bombina]
MATASLDKELSCSICLSIYTNPVMLTCGHNFCQECISSLFNSRQEAGIYICPECRSEFRNRPCLQKNLKLQNIIEHYQSCLPKVMSAEVLCTYCVMSPVPAVKTCLRCEASLCELHLRNHSKSANHILTEPTANVEDRKCSIHNDVVKYFCFKDSSILCMKCREGSEHRGHHVELLSNAFDKKNTQCHDLLRKLKLKKAQTDKQLKELQVHKTEVQAKADYFKGNVTAFFGDLRKVLQAREQDILRDLTRQEEQVLFPLSDLICNLELETNDLQMKILRAEGLCSVTDPVTFLKQICITPDIENVCYGQLEICDDINLDEVIIEVSLQNALHKLCASLPELKVKRGFIIKDASDMILNVNTASINIVLSHDLKYASHTDRENYRPHHSERFTTTQVLTTDRFNTGEHYWKVQTSSEGDWSVGVTYNTVKRKGDLSFIGRNWKSWCLNWHEGELVAEHDNREEYIDSYTGSNLGVYLDYECGRLSFYELSKPMRHLHTFTAEFTEPLYAAFYLDNGGWITIGN